jgi:hypothetical protein
MAAMVHDPQAPPVISGTNAGRRDVAGAAAPANCVRLAVEVRGLPLLLLVATRDVAPGEPLLCAYGDAWWRSIGACLRLLELQGQGHVAPLRLVPGKVTELLKRVPQC